MLLNNDSTNLNFRSRRRSSGQWRERSLHSAETTPTSEVAPSFTEQLHQPLLTNKNMKQPKMTDMSPAVIAQTNWNFVEKLLKVNLFHGESKSNIKLEFFYLGLQGENKEDACGKNGVRGS